MKKRREREEEEEGRRRRSSRKIKGMELFVWLLFMDFWMNMYMDTCWRFAIPLFCVESLFGLVVVLNRGKFCIEKMLGFRGDAVRFF